MPTNQQLVKYGRKKLTYKSKSPALGRCPQRSAVCTKVYTEAPRKPNSSMKKLTKVMLPTRKVVKAYIPGEGHNLQEHSRVMIRGGGVRDLSGVQYRVIRGTLDTAGVAGRAQGRSKYGAKREKKQSKNKKKK